MLIIIIVTSFIDDQLSADSFQYLQKFFFLFSRSEPRLQFVRQSYQLRLAATFKDDLKAFSKSERQDSNRWLATKVRQREPEAHAEEREARFN